VAAGNQLCDAAVRSASSSGVVPGVSGGGGSTRQPRVPTSQRSE